MSKTVLAIVSSPRKNGNTELLVDEFVKGAKEAGHAVEKLCLREKKIAPCLACEACLRNGGACVQKDDMGEILEKFIAADVVVLSSPVYYYSVCAQLKAMIDRTLPIGGGRRQDRGQGVLFYHHRRRCPRRHGADHERFAGLCGLRPRLRGQGEGLRPSLRSRRDQGKAGDGRGL